MEIGGAQAADSETRFETKEEKLGRAPDLHAPPLEQDKNQTKSLQPQAGPSAPQADATPPGVEGRNAEISSLVSPILVIKEAQPGAQVFVDDKLTAAIDSDGQAKISSLNPGQHDLRLSLNGYEDYNQRVDVAAGQASRIVAKLEPFEPPILAEPRKTAALVSPILPPVNSLVPSLAPSIPDFVLERTLKGHSSWVTAVAFSADGQRLASGSWDETVKFWDVSTGQELGTMASKMKEVQALAFSRDGHWLATENPPTLLSFGTPRQDRKYGHFLAISLLGFWAIAGFIRLPSVPMATGWHRAWMTRLFDFGTLRRGEPYAI